MLKALELYGFKSFADRTRFEFSPGITAIIGPNGAGKSNVVDAIKWVLGEQSVKSLRGQEMVDVIFNGSSTRRAMNAAEITLILDNSSGILPIDRPEVAITRRFFRDGEGEYLLNHQPCRLRDIRDLLRGTGLGTSAYCVIEQGKVDSLLQASIRDRRVIFEEAAGISRFRAKRAEALRRLERVEQNLLRLRDIVEEVESRLRSLRVQAGKARRFRELEAQLQSLRTQLALADWNQITRELSQLKQELNTCAEASVQVVSEITRWESKLTEVEEEIQAHEIALREGEARLAATETRIIGLWDRLDTERRNLAEAGVTFEKLREKWIEVFYASTEQEKHLSRKQQEQYQAEFLRRQLTGELARAEAEVAAIVCQLEEYRREYDRVREGSFSYSHQLAQIDRELAVLSDRLETLLSRAGELACREKSVLEEKVRLEQEEAKLEEKLGDLIAGTAEAQKAFELRRLQLSEKEAEVARKREELTAAEQQLAVARERSHLLEEMLARFEGVSPGVQHLLREKQNFADGPLRHVFGLLADGIVAPPEISKLVEIALAGRSHYLVAHPAPELLDYLLGLRHDLQGPVEILWIDQTPDWPPVRPLSLEGHPGVIGRADALVEAVPEIAGVVRRLLSGIWVVDRLERALVLRESLGSGVSFLTLAGEWVGGDGTTVLGPPRWVPGVLSRRSELRLLEEKIADLKICIGQLTNDLSGLSEETRQLAESIEGLRYRHTELLQQTAAAEQALKELKQKRQALQIQIDALRVELAEVERERSETEKKIEAASQTKSNLQQEVENLAVRLEEIRGHQEELARRRTQGDQALANLREKLSVADQECTRLAGDIDHARQILSDYQEQLKEISEQIEDAERSYRRRQFEVLSCEQELSSYCLLRQTVAERVREKWEKLREANTRREHVRHQMEQLRNRLRELELHQHELELAAGQRSSQREALVERFREDYGIDLAAAAENHSPESQIDRTQIQAEIEEIRRRLKALGNVNLEALAELEQIEARHQELAAQYQDLVRAKESFCRILDRIDQASREVFLRTIEEVRGHFSELFRTLFGGGHADILLEEGADPLEAGVEIVARPPGKETRSISLLSGGEKTLASVALLLAIFRSRPSPFCVLDEVDAALDEANIDRFIKLLQEFPGCSQFILITHSKKTMTCAQTIYGVTMQEAGVSRQISVRFEDVSSSDWECTSEKAQGELLPEGQSQSREKLPEGEPQLREKLRWEAA
jgi:chromosome segregation protein